MAIQIYNTLGRRKEVFEPIEPGKVKMYVCGPTVYDRAHVGHAMSSLVFDIIRRYLEYRGYQVKHVMNFTDVDDKIILRANQMGTDPFELAEQYILEYEQHMDALNIISPDIKPRATQEIPQIIEMVQRLIEKGYAYAADGDVYFRVRKDADYGKLSRRKLEDMKAGARIEINERKEDPMDFTLWKAARPGEPSWESPWGKGRPGWHIECSAMNLHHLGEQIDIHGGGNDLIFPHHENEIAQTESITGKPFSQFWIHNGMLQLKGEKMSKSLGNLITIEEFLADHSSDTLRMLVLNSGYRSPLLFTDAVISQADRALERLQSALRPALPGVSGASEDALHGLGDQIESTQAGFIESMDDDFNTAGALGSLFGLVRVVNKIRSNGARDEELMPAQNLLRELAGVLGLRLAEKRAETQLADAFIDLLVELRKELRDEKLYSLADKVRDQLGELGVIIEDSREGSSWGWK